MSTYRSMAGAFCVSMAFLYGCAATPSSVETTLEERLAARGFTSGAAVESIPNFRVSDWRYVDPEHVIVGAGPSQNYLLVLMSRCQSLATVEDLGFSTTAGNLTAMDKLVAQTTIGPEHCPIKQILKLDRLAQ